MHKFAAFLNLFSSFSYAKSFFINSFVVIKDILTALSTTGEMISLKIYLN
jgi:hypothetical protein